VELTNLFCIYEKKHLLLNIDPRLRTNTLLFVDQLNSEEMTNFDSKNALPEMFPNYEVQEEISISFKVFDAAHKLLLAKFNLLEKLNSYMIKVYGF